MSAWELWVSFGRVGGGCAQKGLDLFQHVAPAEPSRGIRDYFSAGCLPQWQPLKGMIWYTPTDSRVRAHSQKLLLYNMFFLAVLSLFFLGCLRKDAACVCVCVLKSSADLSRDKLHAERTATLYGTRVSHESARFVVKEPPRKPYFWVKSAHEKTIGRILEGWSNALCRNNITNWHIFSGWYLFHTCGSYNRAC